MHSGVSGGQPPQSTDLLKGAAPFLVGGGHTRCRGQCHEDPDPEAPADVATRLLPFRLVSLELRGIAAPLPPLLKCGPGRTTSKA